MVGGLVCGGFSGSFDGWFDFVEVVAVMVVQFTVCGWDVWFCFAGVKHDGKVEKKKLFYNILIGM